MATNPIILDYKRQQLQRLPMPQDAAPLIAQPMPSLSPLQMLPVPSAPNVQQIDPAIQATRTRLLGDQAEYQRKLDTGSGISQIKNPFLRTLARIGDTAERIILPGAEAVTAGTEGNHQRLLHQDQARIGNDLSDQYSQAKTGEEQALTNYTLQRPAIARAGLEQKVQTAREKYTSDLRKHGINVTGFDEDTGLPTTEDDPDTMAYHKAAAENMIHAANAEKSTILANIAKNKYVPGTPEYELEMTKVHQKDKQIAIAMGALGLRSQGLELRRENQQANLYGTDMQGNAIPGAPQLEGEDGNLQTVGLRAGNLAVKQQGKVTSFNDLQGSAQHTRQAIEALHASGADLSDPNIVMAMSDPTTIAGKVINGKFVKANLTPQQVQAIGAINQLREQIGIMRATTGGPAAEAQAQRMLSALPEAGDSRSTAINKLNELGGVLDRLRPGAVHVAGGAKVSGQPGSTPAKETKVYQGHTYVKGADGWHLQQ
jgi:hypothetical protein